MIRLEPPLRRATQADAPQLADFVNLAGEGLPFYIWKQLATEDQDPFEIGRARQAAKIGKADIIVVDHGAGAVAGLTGYAIGSRLEPVGEDIPSIFRPLQELENQDLDIWYVNVLACFPKSRGQGLGSLLLNFAEYLARDQGLHCMSVIVADDNAGARRLYERNAYEEVARLPCVKEGWESNAKHWLLLIKDIRF